MADRLPAALGPLLRVARERLAAAGIDDPALDSRLIVEHFSGTTRTQAIAEPRQKVGSAALSAIETALGRRVAGEPAHRILGYREFYGLRLSLSPETLEPRPDTETLVDAILPFARTTAERLGGCRILDLGTGTGAIALALLNAVPAASATGVDISEGALAKATENARDLGLGGRFKALHSNWFEKVSGSYHVIASNPPYIPSQEIGNLQDEVRDFDPHRALDGGADGLDPYRVIAAEAAGFLEAQGKVAVEIGHTQKNEVTGIFAAAGYKIAGAYRDLGGNDRVLVFER
ncbi:peptide chain release factor N(5)-glutamine methyltransferase [Mesorhizobium sp.]|jgi:release factor glutamine methyltransferase|uniref:peptide chain release factor N(5)-glutamine methyltransferase n=1 Tax=Mesorhizobium sp. TaxID=1871066 RepID=UPI000FE2DFFD|nr:peptide chain release factor N(5)-glutamine methyltransferase [Mesorhizobium sp.]RWH67885.1 MAG: peptide chain release factor N(5)-glutamine methyltransferase [Mesorhizobium sp.]RWL24546.1 MAG: peptide chain release factor N(5)-glutamine methyltransferase [Mesorhizobium sp.]RWL26723.1 MAG: peptide chain release factor N(5)-glutamine methyltransferase [Mesorhizobium sp.]RWL36139.1 MAG: peptide chain release factor N(5)-glutamine methyltransferase [Mesorhizobium sp.]RWL49567.1 MAG: peptide ch